MLNDWLRELGDPLAWITTAAVLIAAGQYVGERRKRRDDTEREARSQATRLMAWAVTDARDTRVWGVRILNDSGSTFHNVVIDARMRNHHPRLPITMRIVPPGDYLVEPKNWGPNFGWELPGSTAEYPGILRPVASTEKFGVDRIRFSDNRGQTWITDERATLRRA